MSMGKTMRCAYHDASEPELLNYHADAYTSDLSVVVASVILMEGRE